MAANTQPIFLLTPNFGTASDGNPGTRLSTANTTRDLSTTVSADLLFTAGADGSRIDAIDFTHAAASQTQASIAAVGRIFLTTSAGGANPKLIKEIALTAVTPSAIAIGAVFTITFSPALTLKSGQFLWASISTTQTSGYYDVVCKGGNY